MTICDLGVDSPQLFPFLFANRRIKLRVLDAVSSIFPVGASPFWFRALVFSYGLRSRVLFCAVLPRVLASVTLYLYVFNWLSPVSFPNFIADEVDLTDSLLLEVRLSDYMDFFYPGGSVARTPARVLP